LDLFAGCGRLLLAVYPAKERTISMLIAGLKSDVKWGDGNWVFFDVGFSNNTKTCGLLIGDGAPVCLHYGEAKRTVLEHIRRSTQPTKLVIEAPLSVCFDAKGNPKGRKIEREGSETRYWYAGPGCCVMTGATYLVRDIHEANADGAVILFEAFVTFKKAGNKSNHSDDVCRLRDVVKQADTMNTSIYSADDLRTDSQDRLTSAFQVSGHEIGIPAVIKA
jgi:hypothetical protein